ncbi:MAG: MEMO1 family protein [Candidatus Thermoplasmatota archaeon]
MHSIRRAVVAGQFYPGTKTALLRQLEECFLDERGVGKRPTLGVQPRLQGLLVPHAGYQYSGAIASHAYYELAAHGFADTFVILGPNHTGTGSGVSLMMKGAWTTPLGEIPINETIAKKLHKGIIDADDTAHYYEHSIEVQLPFLQYIAQGKSFDFVPICMMMQDEDTAYEIATILVDAIKTSQRRIVLIASTDFSHVGFNYATMPPQGLRVDEFAHRQDAYALEKIRNFDPAGLIRTVYEHNITMCGYGPVAVVLWAAQKLGAQHVELLKYGTSYEVHPSSSCVGYASCSIY